MATPAENSDPSDIQWVISCFYFQLPLELQAKVRSYIASKQKKFIDGAGNNQKPDIKTIKVPIPTFPPTAMVYSLNAGR